MHYTMLMTEEIQGSQSLNLDRSGNKYVVGLYNKDTKEYKHRTFDRIEDARDKYIELCGLMIQCLYSWENRIEFLLNER